MQYYILKKRSRIICRLSHQPVFYPWVFKVCFKLVLMSDDESSLKWCYIRFYPIRYDSYSIKIFFEIATTTSNHKKNPQKSCWRLYLALGDLIIRSWFSNGHAMVLVPMI